VFSKKEERRGGDIILQPRAGHHDKVMIQARSSIGIDEGDTIPSFRNALFDNVRRKDCCVSFIGPQVILS
jgi:hypothetical protein